MEPKILYIGPLEDFSGYANASRNYVLALDSVGCNLATRKVTYDGGKITNKRLVEIAQRDLQNVDIVVQHTTPNESEYKPGLFNALYFAWETDRVPEEWVQQLNKMDLVMVPCSENVKAARRSGVLVPIEKVEHTFNPEKYDRKLNPLNFGELEDRFKFLSICQVSKKKGIDVLLRAYLSEFTPSDDTLLVLKFYFGPQDSEEHKNRMVETINKIKSLMRLKEYPPIYLIHSIMEDDDVARLYRSCDSYVLPARGEGWSIPHFDAMGYGLPPIATGWGGPTEFINKDCGWLVDYHMSPCFDMPHPHEFMYTSKDNWAEPHIDSLRKAMREAHQEYRVSQSQKDCAWNLRVANCKTRVKDYSYDIVGGKMKNIIYEHYNRWKNAN